MTRQVMMTLACGALLATAAHGFNGECCTVEPITVVSGDMPVISERGTPVAVGVTVSNSSDAAVETVLHLNHLQLGRVVQSSAADRARHLIADPPT